jgi:hypothetical protein
MVFVYFTDRCRSYLVGILIATDVTTVTIVCIGLLKSPEEGDNLMGEMREFPRTPSDQPPDSRPGGFNVVPTSVYEQRGDPGTPPITEQILSPQAQDTEDSVLVRIRGGNGDATGKPATTAEEEHKVDKDTGSFEDAQAAADQRREQQEDTERRYKGDEPSHDAVPRGKTAEEDLPAPPVSPEPATMRILRLVEPPSDDVLVAEAEGHEETPGQQADPEGDRNAGVIYLQDQRMAAEQKIIENRDDSDLAFDARHEMPPNRQEVLDDITSLAESPDGDPITSARQELFAEAAEELLGDTSLTPTEELPEGPEIGNATTRYTDISGQAVTFVASALQRELTLLAVRLEQEGEPQTRAELMVGIAPPLSEAEADSEGVARAVEVFVALPVTTRPVDWSIITTPPGMPPEPGTHDLLAEMGLADLTLPLSADWNKFILPPDQEEETLARIRDFMEKYVPEAEPAVGE